MGRQSGDGTLVLQSVDVTLLLPHTIGIRERPVVMGNPRPFSTLKLALEALNTARRFRAGQPDGYRIASQIEAALKLAEINPFEH